MIALLLCLSATAFAQSYSGGLPVSVNNASVGTNGAAAPTSSTEIGFVDGSGKLQPFPGSGGGIAITGTATANQGTPAALANRWPVTLVDFQGVTITAKQLNNQVTSSDVGIVTNSVIHGLTTGGGGGYVDVKVNPSGALTVDATQSGTWNIGTITNVVSVTNTGKAAVAHLRLDYSSTNVTTAAYVQVSAAIGGACNEIDVFDSSGQTLVLATGGAGNETDQIYITPGGNGRVVLRINSGLRISLKAVSNNATAGEFDLNCYN